MNITTYVAFSFYQISSINCKLLICSAVDFCGVNPYCCYQYALLLLKCIFSFNCIHLSRMLSIMCLKVIGLQLLGVDLFPSLQSSITLDSFSIYVLSQSLSFHSCYIILKIISFPHVLPNLITYGFTIPDVALFSFILCIISIISSHFGPSVSFT